MLFCGDLLLSATFCDNSLCAMCLADAQEQPGYHAMSSWTKICRPVSSLHKTTFVSCSLKLSKLCNICQNFYRKTALGQMLFGISTYPNGNSSKRGSSLGHKDVKVDVC